MKAKRKNTLKTFALAIAAVLMASAATAGDVATLTPLGFSEDGSIFAFEEYGVQDGSGFPYSNIYFIDTARDTFLDGTPIRMRIDDETASISDVRGQAVHDALALIQDYKLLDHPGQLVAFNPVTEESSAPDHITYREHANLSGRFDLSMETFALDPTSACAAITPDGKGFRLSLTTPDGGTKTVFEDTRIPVSRSCPTDYRLGGIMTYRSPSSGSFVHVALVTVLSYGFEGSDGRWIAIPFKP